MKIGAIVYRAPNIKHYLYNIILGGIIANILPLRF